MRKMMFSLLLLTFGSMQIQAQDRSDIGKMMKAKYPDSEPGAALGIWNAGIRIWAQGYGLSDLATRALISEDTHFRMASVSKQITALSIYHLIQEGALNFDTPISTFFQSLSPSIKGITVGQLLQHSSGIWDYESLIPKEQSTQLSDRDVLEFVRGVDRTYFQPGTQFRYSNTGYCLLALIVAKLSGQSYADYARKTVFEPLGMHSTILYESEREDDIEQRAYGYHLQEGVWKFADQSLTSATQGDGGVYTSVVEYGHWVEALLQGKKDLESYLQTLKAQAIPVKDGVSYSMGWFMYPTEDHGFFLFHSGESTGFHNMVYIHPQKQEAVVLFTNRDDMGIAANFQEVLHQVGMAEAWTLKTSMFSWLNQTY